MARRKKEITEFMERQAAKAYFTCAELLKGLYAGEVISQTKIIKAIADAWKVHNRFAQAIRHNLKVEYDGYSETILWKYSLDQTEPDKLHCYLDTVGGEEFSSNKYTSLIGLARELLMVVVNYRQQKIIEMWKMKQALHDELNSLASELQGEKKHHDEDDSAFLFSYQKVPLEDDSYVAGIHFSIATVEGFLRSDDTFSSLSIGPIQRDIEFAVKHYQVLHDR